MFRIKHIVSKETFLKKSHVPIVIIGLPIIAIFLLYSNVWKTYFSQYRTIKVKIGVE